MYWNHRVVKMAGRLEKKVYKICEAFYGEGTERVTGIVDLGVYTVIKDEDSTGDEILDYKKSVSELTETLAQMSKDINNDKAVFLDEKEIAKLGDLTPASLKIEEEE